MSLEITDSDRINYLNENCVDYKYTDYDGLPFCRTHVEIVKETDDDKYYSPLDLLDEHIAFYISKHGKDWEGNDDDKDSIRLEWLLDNLKYVDKDSYKPFWKNGYYEFYQKTDIQDLRKLIDANMFVESIGRLVLSSSDLAENDLIEIKSGVDRLRKMCNNKSSKHENHKFFSRQLKSEKYIKPRGNI